MSVTERRLSPPTELRLELESLDGVVHALLDHFPTRIHLVCDPAAATAPVEAAARLVLLQQGSESADAAVDISYHGTPQPRRRVRFLDLSVDRQSSATQARAVVRLEWRERVHEGVAEGGGGTLGELRTCAQAALRALESVLEGKIEFELVGVKPVRIFDRELVATLLRTNGTNTPTLMGFAPGKDECHAATLSVLNATNRMLGNYLSTTD